MIIQWYLEILEAINVSLFLLPIACQKADLGHQTSKCPDPIVPDNGGLACVTVNNSRYCKPMCNKVCLANNFHITHFNGKQSNKTDQAFSY